MDFFFWLGYLPCSEILVIFLSKRVPLFLALEMSGGSGHGLDVKTFTQYERSRAVLLVVGLG